MLSIKKVYLFLFSIFFLSGCTSVNNNNMSNKTNFDTINAQSELRDIQTRTFYNVDKTKVEKAIVSTMLDEDYYIKMINSKNGIITAIGNKNSIDLNFVATFKENLDEGISVRFSLSSLKGSLFNKKYKTLREEYLYDYLFSKFTKSVSLENTYVAKEINIEKKEILKTVQNVIEKKSEVTRFPFYSIQFLSSKDENIAKESFTTIVNKYKDARLEKLKYYYVIRLGKFKGYSKATKLHTTLKNEFKDSIIVSIKRKY